MKAQKVYFGEEIDNIILKSKHDRTRYDNEKLLFAFQSFPFFSKVMNKYQYGDLMVETIVKSLRFFELPKGTPLFRHGEIISSMYIVCKGNINLYRRPLNIKISPPDLKAKGYNKFKAMFKKHLLYSLDKELEYMYAEGQSIGEKYILSERKRPSLCEAHTNCIIGELTSTDYLSIFEKTDFLEKNSIHSLLSSLPFFLKSKNSLTENIMKRLTKRSFNKGEKVYRQGDPFDKIYIIRKGTFQVSIKSSVKFLSSIDMFCFFDLYKDLYEPFSTNRGFELKGEYEEIKEYKLINFGTGKFLGNFELKLKSNNYLLTVQCLSDKNEVFEIPRRTFEMLLTPFTRNILSEETAKEMMFFQKRVKHIQDVVRLRGKGNKYMAVVLNKIRLKEEQILNSIPSIQIESKDLSPVASINNTKICSPNPNRRLFSNNKNQKDALCKKEMNNYFTLYRNTSSLATFDTNKKYKRNKLIKEAKTIDTNNKVFIPPNLIIKKAQHKLNESDSYRPQTSNLYKYKEKKQQATESAVTQESSDNNVSTRLRLLSQSYKILGPQTTVMMNNHMAFNSTTKINSDKMQTLFGYKKK